MCYFLTPIMRQGHLRSPSCMKIQAEIPTFNIPAAKKQELFSH